LRRCYRPEGVQADRNPASARRAWEHSEVTTDAMERAAVLKSSGAVCQADRVCRIHCRFAPDRPTAAQSKRAPTPCRQNQSLQKRLQKPRTLLKPASGRGHRRDQSGVHLARDLPGTGSKTFACGVSGTTESSDFATAARQIAGQATLLRDFRHSMLLILLFLRDSPGTAKRDLGAG
jgi:hypothetical protein